jgi:hypothetical protein
MSFLGELRIFARRSSVYIKIVAGLAGLVAAYLWYQSAISIDAAAAVRWNTWAAVMSGASMLCQAVAALIDAWIAPTASWA